MLHTKQIKSKKTLKIAGVDFDRWLETNVDDDATPEEEPLKYGKKLVAFLDLLGITDRIQKERDGKESDIITTMNNIKGIVEIEIKNCTQISDLNMLYLSDSFIFSCSIDNLIPFLQILSIIQMRILIECQTLLRGAVEYGDITIQDDGKQIIGPAYIDAYQKQEKHAIYPRIIVGKSIIDHMKNRNINYRKLFVSRDRESSLDYLQVYQDLEKKNRIDLITKLRRNEVYDFLSKEFKKYSDEDKVSIRAKYAWTISYFQDKKVWSDEEKHCCW